MKKKRVYNTDNELYGIPKEYEDLSDFMKKDPDRFYPYFLKALKNYFPEANTFIVTGETEDKYKLTPTTNEEMEKIIKKKFN